MDADVENFRNILTYRIKIDPGSKHTGIAVVCNETGDVMLYMQIEHRGEQVKKNLDARKGARRNRRSRETRYRRPKFRPGREQETARPDGWLPPSVKSTADSVISWVRRLSRWIRITECSFEAVRFDSQLMDNPEVEGAEYQHGTLFGTELREYLLEKCGHTCQYCGGKSGDTVLEWEHIRPKSRGGSDSVKNATLSCRRCNSEKGSMTPDEWSEKIASKKVLSELDRARLNGIEDVKAGTAKVSNRYSAWAGSCRRYIERFLFGMFGEVECSSGGKTKYNRTEVLHLPKDHHYDALCVGAVPEGGYRDRTNGWVLMTKATGRGSRFRGLTNSCGIITVKFRDRSKTCRGFMTGDIVRADVPKGKHIGRHTGRITIRKSGTFALAGTDGVRRDVNCRCMTVLQKADGYNYRNERRFA